MTHPLIWEADLKKWIRMWNIDGAIAVLGLKGAEKVPKLNRQYTLKAKRPLA